MLLAREYFLKKDYEKAYSEYLECLNLPEIRLPHRKLVLLETIGKLGDLCALEKDYDKAIEYYNLFIQEDKTYREPYFCIGEIYNQRGMYAMAKAIVELGIKESYQHFDWVERKDNWLYKAYDILSVSEYYLGDLDKAVAYGSVSARHNPNDLRILKNYIVFLEDKLKTFEPKKEEDE